MGTDTIQIAASAKEFFREHVTEVMSRQKLQVSQDIEFYLVNLLDHFTEPRSAANLCETPLAIQLKTALEAPSEERLKILKSLGDSSLYVAGFFQDYFNRKIYDIDYFISIGSVAYSHTAQILREKDHGFSGTYEALSELFHKLVEVVAEVADQVAGFQPKNVLATYDRWTKNQSSERLRRQLEESGIMPIPINMKVAQ